MIQKIKNKLLILGTLLAMLIPVAVPVVVSAAPDAKIQDSLCSGAVDLKVSETPSTTCDATKTGGTDKVNSLITTIINVISVVVGVIAVIMIIIGGFRYITSGGKEEGVKGAKNTILYALIGLIVVALAQIIVKFVLNKATA